MVVGVATRNNTHLRARRGPTTIGGYKQAPAPMCPQRPIDRILLGRRVGGYTSGVSYVCTTATELMELLLALRPLPTAPVKLDFAYFSRSRAAAHGAAAPGTCNVIDCARCDV